MAKTKAELEKEIKELRNEVRNLRKENQELQEKAEQKEANQRELPDKAHAISRNVNGSKFSLVTVAFDEETGEARIESVEEVGSTFHASAKLKKAVVDRFNDIRRGRI